MPNPLYRGVNHEFHERTGGVLTPKDNLEFIRSPEFGRAEWGNAYWGKNEQNAVVEHQQHQAGYPTSGISTTPLIERAKFYATHGGKYAGGYLYVIDQDLCASLGVSVFVVTEIVPQPAIPEDQEVILVAKDYGTLPAEVIVEVREFHT